MPGESYSVGDQVAVVWADHVAGPQGWHDLGDCPEVLEVITFGVIVGLDEMSLTIASSLQWDHAKRRVDADGTVGHVHALVRSCIRDVMVLAHGGRDG